jgi:hypothetical protein
VVLEATARTDNGTLIVLGRREYLEIGYDLDGNQRMGSWQIKEIVDLALQPGRATEERFTAQLPAETKRAEVRVRLTMHPSPAKEILVQETVRTIHFEK